MPVTLPPEHAFRPMTPADLEPVLATIVSLDEEVAQDAAESYDTQGLNGQYVLTFRDKVVGVTGVRPIPDTDGAYWLSWTYMDYAGAPPGERLDGPDLLNLVAEALEGLGARKLFVQLSSYDGPIGRGRTHGGGEESYLAAGFERELTQRRYYARSEDLIVLARRLRPPQPAEDIEPDPARATIVDSDEIPETDDAYYIDWEFADDGREDSPKAIAKWLRKIEKWKGRVVFIGIPVYAPGVVEQFREAGFKEDGRLRDLIADGIDEIFMRKDIA